MLVDEMTSFSPEIFFVNLNIQRATGHQSCIYFNFWKILRHGGSYRWIHDSTVLDQPAVLEPVVRHAICTFEFIMEGVIAKFKRNELKNQQAGSEPNAEPENVNG